MASSANVYNYDGTKSFQLVKWKIRVGSQLYYNSPILSYKQECLNSDLKEPLLKYKSNVGGIVTELLVSEGDTVITGTSLLKIQPCTHPVIMKDMCAECGTDLRNLDRDNFEKLTSAASFSMVHVVPELKVSQEQADKLSRADEDGLLKSRRLVLLVDLDQTLIHTTNDNVPENLKDVSHFQLYGKYSPWYHTKVRPGTPEFLENISKYYELHICTFGARLYAHKIAEILDPDKKFFSHRILSRDECFDPTSKTANLKALFPRGDHMVCIIDDREDVWNFASNVIHVKPYTFFHNTGDINAPPISNSKETSHSQILQDEKKSNVSKAENNKSANSSKLSKDETNNTVDKSDPPQDSNNIDSNLVNENNSTPSECTSSTEGDKINKEEPKPDTGSEKSITPQSEQKNDTSKDKELITIVEDDDYLMYLEEILKSVHKTYYDLCDKIKENGESSIPDLKKVVPDVRKNVLKNTNIVFSSVVPTNCEAETHHFWTLAESLGASVSKELILDSSKQRTTHLIASKPGTAKVNAAKRQDKIHIVTVDWLLCCEERWERADERLFRLPKDIPVESEKRERVFRRHRRLKRPLNHEKKSEKTEEEKFSERVFAEAGLAFSLDEIEDMDKEIEQACSEESDDEDSQNSSVSSDSSSSGESLSSGDYPKGWKKRRKLDALEEKLLKVIDDESSDAETIGSVDEEMAEAVKNELAEF